MGVIEQSRIVRRVVERMEQILLSEAFTQKLANAIMNARIDDVIDNTATFGEPVRRSELIDPDEDS